MASDLRWFGIVLVLLSVACAGDLAATEPAPHVRCLAGPAPEDRQWTRGGLTLTLEGRALRLSTERSALRIAVFGGPAPGVGVLGAELKDASADLWIMLGGLGDSSGAALDTLVRLARAPVPVLLLAGGRDEHGVWQGAFEGLDRTARQNVVDLTALDRVELGGEQWIPIAGAPGGRYARTEQSCGFGATDLRGRADRLGPTGERRRRLLSWAAPRGPWAVGLEGAQAGDPMLAAFMERVGARGGLFAWPETQAGRVFGGPGDLALVVPPAAGRRATLADGRRVSGPTILQLSAAGLATPGLRGPAR